MKCRKESKRCIISFNKNVNFESILSQKEILTKALNLKNPITLYASEVTVIDTVSLQLLLSFTLSATQNNLQWQWEAPSNNFIKTAELLGMRVLLNLPQT